ncbi:MAG TPA: hypothetical protein VLI90_15240 [Tepidisphaeraceae bacterium]|nr:hypothetical protein [Tepidisphaeraceae bacterium]
MLPATGFTFAQERAPQPSHQRAAADRQQMSAEQMVAQWPEDCQKAFKQTVAKYGQPNGVTPTLLI